MRNSFLLFSGILFVAATGLSGCATHARLRGPDPLDREARLLGKFLSGRYAERAIDPAGAARAYTSGLADAPGNAILLEGALSAALTAGDRQGAIALAKTVRGSGDAPVAALVTAAHALSKGQASQAHAAAQRVSGSPLDDMTARLLSAWSLAASGDGEAALLAMDQTDPRFRSAGLGGLVDDQIAMLLWYLGENERAVRQFERAGAVPVRLSGVLLRYAQAQSAAGRADLALATLSARNFQGSDALVLQAAQRLAAGQELHTALTAQEGAALGMVSFAIALSGDFRAPNYLPYVTLARIANPQADDITVLAAEAHRQLGDGAGARAALDAIATSSPYATAGNVQRALLLQGEGDLPAAIAEGERAALSRQRFAMSVLAGFYRQAELWDKARGVYDQIIAAEKEPDWTLYYLRGAAQERLKRWPEAESDLRKALELSPDEPEVLNYLGYSWVDRGVNLSDGLALLERAVQLQPDAGHIIDSLGWAKFRLKRYQEALDDLERAVLLLPGDATINDHLGDVYLSLGRKREAGFQWRRALNLSKPEEADALRRKLQAHGLSEKSTLASVATP